MTAAQLHARLSILIGDPVAAAGTADGGRFTKLQREDALNMAQSNVIDLAPNEALWTITQKETVTVSSSWGTAALPSTNKIRRLINIFVNTKLARRVHPDFETDIDDVDSLHFGDADNPVYFLASAKITYRPKKTSGSDSIVYSYIQEVADIAVSTPTQTTLPEVLHVPMIYEAAHLLFAANNQPESNEFKDMYITQMSIVHPNYKDKAKV